MILFDNKPEWFSDSDDLLRNWLVRVASKEGLKIGDLIYNFVSESQILDTNKSFLQHDYLTDIITFNYNEGKEVRGEVYICSDVVKENAKDLQVQKEVELRRVIIHGLLHLMGYDDHEESDIRQMRDAEEKSLLLHAKILENN